MKKVKVDLNDRIDDLDEFVKKKLKELKQTKPKPSRVSGEDKKQMDTLSRELKEHREEFEIYKTITAKKIEKLADQTIQPQFPIQNTDEETKRSAISSRQKKLSFLKEEITIK